MAVLSKIRKLPIFLLILIIGLPLLTFVMDPSALKDFFSANKVNSIGEVGGESITRQQFAKELASYKRRTQGKLSEMQTAKGAWSNLIRKRVYQKQLNDAGITIGEVDIMNALYEDASIKQNPQFQTQGIFDKSKLKQYLAKIKDENSESWIAFQQSMGDVKSGLETAAYNNLVSAGLGVSLAEGKMDYFSMNTKLNSEMVYVPYETISDSVVKVTDSEVQEYINDHKSQFEVDASRDIKFVKFNILPSENDGINIRNEVAKLLNDRDVYSEAAKTNVTEKGFNTTKDYKGFFIDNKSDLQYTDGVQFKTELSKYLAGKIDGTKKDTVYGPYKDENYIKMSKLVDVISIPDSVKARHILIPFVGSQRATPDIKRTEVQAKQFADSLLNVVKTDFSKFGELAKANSSDKGSAAKDGDLGWFQYKTMVPEFRDYAFLNKTGDIGVVKSIFGFHIIKIDNQKNFQKAYKLVTFGRKIDASPETENKIFQDVELFLQDLSGGKDFVEVAKTKSLEITPAVGLKALDESVPGLGKDRSVVNWLFGKDIKVGNYSRFDVQNGYIVATVISKTDKGLMPVEKAMASVRPILVNKKKAKELTEKMKGSTLKEIADATKTNVTNVKDLMLQSPTLVGVGREPAVVGAMLYAKKDKVNKGIVGDRGVFAFKLNDRELPAELPDYNTERKRVGNQRRNKTYQVFEALKKASGVKDNLGSFYGATQ